MVDPKKNNWKNGGSRRRRRGTRVADPKKFLPWLIKNWLQFFKINYHPTYFKAISVPPQSFHLGRHAARQGKTEFSMNVFKLKLKWSFFD
jgi:hypothetical protein